MRTQISLFLLTGIHLDTAPAAELSGSFSESNLGLKGDYYVQKLLMLDAFNSVRILPSPISEYTALRKGMC